MAIRVPILEELFGSIHFHGSLLFQGNRRSKGLSPLFSFFFVVFHFFLFFLPTLLALQGEKSTSVREPASLAVETLYRPRARTAYSFWERPSCFLFETRIFILLLLLLCVFEKGKGKEKDE